MAKFTLESMVLVALTDVDQKQINVSYDKLKKAQAQ